MKDNFPPDKEAALQAIIDETNFILNALSKPYPSRIYMIKALITFKDTSWQIAYVCQHPEAVGARVFVDQIMVPPSFPNVYTFSSEEYALAFIRDTIAIAHESPKFIRDTKFKIQRMDEDLRGRLAALCVMSEQLQKE
jgi:hypothetical protein